VVEVLKIFQIFLH
jgi:hypothetical protein